MRDNKNILRMALGRHSLALRDYLHWSSIDSPRGFTTYLVLLALVLPFTGSFTIWQLMILVIDLDIATFVIDRLIDIFHTYRALEGELPWE